MEDMRHIYRRCVNRCVWMDATVVVACQASRAVIVVALVAARRPDSPVGYFLQWFSTHSICPVAECKCHCTALDKLELREAEGTVEEGLASGAV